MQVGDSVHVDIIENGYWKASARGKIAGETAKFWIVESGSHHFWNSAKGAFVPRRFSKTSGYIQPRVTA